MNYCLNVFSEMGYVDNLKNAINIQTGEKLTSSHVVFSNSKALFQLQANIDLFLISPLFLQVIRFVCPDVTNLSAWVVVVTMYAGEAEIHHLALQAIALFWQHAVWILELLWCTSVTLVFTSRCKCAKDLEIWSEGPDWDDLNVI